MSGVELTVAGHGDGGQGRKTRFGPSSGRRYHLVMDAINNAKRLPRGATALKQWCEQQLTRHERYVVEHLEDMPEVRDWSLGDWAQRG